MPQQLLNKYHNRITRTPVFVCSGNNDNWLYKMDGETGDTVWSLMEDNGVESFNFDLNGDLFVGVFGGRLSKYTPDGTLIWSKVVYQYKMHAIQIVPSGYIYVGSAGGAVKVDQNGDVVWTYDPPSHQVYDIDVDVYGNVYISREDNLITKLDENGAEIWSINLGNDSRGIRVDGNDNLFVLDKRDVQKMDLDGNQVWSVNVNDPTESLCLATSGHFYLTVYATRLDKRSKSDGSVVWSYSNLTYGPKGVSIDEAENVYFGNNNGDIQKLDKDGNHLWTNSDQNGSQVSGTVATPGTYKTSGKAN